MKDYINIHLVYEIWMNAVVERVGRFAVNMLGIS